MKEARQKNTTVCELLKSFAPVEVDGHLLSYTANDAHLASCTSSPDESLVKNAQAPEAATTQKKHNFIIDLDDIGSEFGVNPNVGEVMGDEGPAKSPKSSTTSPWNYCRSVIPASLWSLVGGTDNHVILHVSGHAEDPTVVRTFTPDIAKHMERRLTEADLSAVFLCIEYFSSTVQARSLSRERCARF